MFNYLSEIEDSASSNSSVPSAEIEDPFDAENATVYIKQVAYYKCGDECDGVVSDDNGAILLGGSPNSHQEFESSELYYHRTHEVYTRKIEGAYYSYTETSFSEYPRAVRVELEVTDQNGTGLGLTTYTQEVSRNAGGQIETRGRKFYCNTTLGEVESAFGYMKFGVTTLGETEEATDGEYDEAFNGTTFNGTLEDGEGDDIFNGTGVNGTPDDEGDDVFTYDSYGKFLDGTYVYKYWVHGHNESVENGTAYYTVADGNGGTRFYSIDFVESVTFAMVAQLSGDSAIATSFGTFANELISPIETLGNQTAQLDRYLEMGTTGAGACLKNGMPGSLAEAMEDELLAESSAPIPLSLVTEEVIDVGAYSYTNTTTAGDRRRRRTDDSAPSRARKDSNCIIETVPVGVGELEVSRCPPSDGTGEWITDWSPKYLQVQFPASLSRAGLQLSGSGKDERTMAVTERGRVLEGRVSRSYYRSRGYASYYYEFGGVSTSCAPGDRRLPTVAQGTRSNAYVYKLERIRYWRESCSGTWFWRRCYWRSYYYYSWRRYTFGVNRRIQPSYPVTPSLTPYFCPSPLFKESPLFKVLKGGCIVSADGLCVSTVDGSRKGVYANKDYCRIQAMADLTFDDDQKYIIESTYDFVTINGKRFNETGKGPSSANSLKVNEEWTWRSDSSVRRAGWTLCATRNV